MLFVALVLAALLPRNLAASALVATDFFSPLAPEEEHPQTARAIASRLPRDHYRRSALDDSLSSAVYDRFLADLDPTRSYFLAHEVQELGAYRYALDEALGSGELKPAFEIFNLYQQRVAERLVALVERLEGGLEAVDFSVEEVLASGRGDAPWPATEVEMEDLWRRRLKSDVLNLKLAGKPLEDIAGVLLKRYRRQLKRVSQMNSEDVFQAFMNALARTYDPHTRYLSPRGTENFNIRMSLSLEGIGALLRADGEFTRVVSLVPAGPAEKSGLLKPSDRIVGVGQGISGEIVDVVGWRLDDVVDLIRGPKETTVRLEIIPANADDDSQTRAIQIVRNTVKLEEQAARKEVVELERDGRTYRVGVLDIPTFYLDFRALRRGDSDYRSTTRDVRRLLQELETEGVDGVIVDLRDNSGGSLQEVHSLTGLFVREGPIVQVRRASGQVDVLTDPDGGIAYPGPLAVLVNRLSASASEIFSGAIQDYERGVIIGERTFGKGTVQTVVRLENDGQLNATMAKFYRITGESVQHRGVIPDIPYPSMHDTSRVGESALPRALPWNRIQPVSFRRYSNLAGLVPVLLQSYTNRVEENPDYRYHMARVDRARTTTRREAVSLQEATRRQEREDAREWRLDLENKRRVAKQLPPIEKLSDLDGEQPEDGADALEADTMLLESGQVLIDLIERYKPPESANSRPDAAPAGH